MVDGLTRKLFEHEFLISAAFSGGQIIGSGVFFQIPMNIEMGGGQHNEITPDGTLPFFGELLFDVADRIDLREGEVRRCLRYPEDVPDMDIREHPVDN